MSEAPSSAALVIGIGNVFRGDDGAGRMVARRLREMTGALRVIESSGEATGLMEAWQEADPVILIDAVFSGAETGTIHRFDAHLDPIPLEFLRTSTHAFSVGQAIELARALGEAPSHLFVYGIEGEDFDPGEGLTPDVEAAVNQVAAEIAARFTTPPSTDPGTAEARCSADPLE